MRGKEKVKKKRAEVEEWSVPFYVNVHDDMQEEGHSRVAKQTHRNDRVIQG